MWFYLYQNSITCRCPCTAAAPCRITMVQWTKHMLQACTSVRGQRPQCGDAPSFGGQCIPEVDRRTEEAARGGMHVGIEARAHPRIEGEGFASRPPKASHRGRGMAAGRRLSAGATCRGSARQPAGRDQVSQAWSRFELFQDVFRRNIILMYFAVSQLVCCQSSTLLSVKYSLQLRSEDNHRLRQSTHLALQAGFGLGWGRGEEGAGRDEAPP